MLYQVVLALILRFSVEKGAVGDDIAETTTTEDYPWMVSLYAEGETISHHFCGGSLIFAEYPLVLTAASCIEDIEDSLEIEFGDESYELKAALGRDDLADEEVINYVTLDWHSSRIHADYDPSTKRNNIGLILLIDSEGTADEYDNIEIVTLADESDICCEENQPVRLIGYGFDRESLNESFLAGAGDEDLFVRTLQRSGLNYVDRDTCEKHLQLYEKYRLDYNSDTDPHSITQEEIDALGDIDEYKYVLDGTFCAKHESQLACVGDNGNPLVKHLLGSQPSEEPQIGLTSLALHECANVPTVFTDVSYFFGWIQSAAACLLEDVEDSYVQDPFDVDFNATIAEVCDDICDHEMCPMPSETDSSLRVAVSVASLFSLAFAVFFS